MILRGPYEQHYCLSVIASNVLKTQYLHKLFMDKETLLKLQQFGPTCSFYRVWAKKA